jgi:hypothetical protein
VVVPSLEVRAIALLAFFGAVSCVSFGLVNSTDEVPMIIAPADLRSAPLSPAVIGAALDCLATMPSANPLEPSTMAAIGRAIGCTHDEAKALAVRVRAAALILADACWHPWSTYHKTLPREEKQAFDLAFVTVVAELPLDASLRFAPENFCYAILDRAVTLRHD